MGIPMEQARQIEALRGLIERLSAPDLTLNEAKALRGQMSVLLGTADPRVPSDSTASSPDPTTTMRVAV